MRQGLIRRAYRVPRAPWARRGTSQPSSDESGAAGVAETAEVAGRYLGMDDVIGTRVGVRSGRYTGELATRLHLETGKGLAIGLLI